MDDASEPFGPALVFREKYQPAAAGLFPLLAKMKRQHAERRRRGDRRTGRFGAFPDGAFSGRVAGADLLAFLHEASIVIQGTQKLRIAGKAQIIAFVGDWMANTNKSAIRAALPGVL